MPHKVHYDQDTKLFRLDLDEHTTLVSPSLHDLEVSLDAMDNYQVNRASETNVTPDVSERAMKPRRRLTHSRSTSLS